MSLFVVEIKIFFHHNTIVSIYLSVCILMYKINTYYGQITDSLVIDVLFIFDEI